jgi:hypothetical protein
MRGAEISGCAGCRPRAVAHSRLPKRTNGDGGAAVLRCTSIPVPKTKPEDCRTMAGGLRKRERRAAVAGDGAEAIGYSNVG